MYPNTPLGHDIFAALTTRNCLKKLCAFCRERAEKPLKINENPAFFN
jgi:hypothetical protein